MKKVGITTTVYGNNFGEALQAFAMRKAIKTYVEDTDAEIIQYIWKRHKELINPGYEQYAEAMMGKKAIFDEFRLKEIGVDNNVLDQLTEETVPAFDKYVFGSDQIWNTNAWEIPEFFGSFVPKGKSKIAYAASVGLKSDSPLLKTELFEKYMDTFDYISVREKEHCELVRRFTGKPVEFVTDPTILLDLEVYENLILKSRAEKPDNNYVFYYQPHSADGAILSLVNKIARYNKLDVVHTFAEIPEIMFPNNSYGARFLGPYEFLDYIKNASMVITRSYHAAVFSILFHKPFYVYVDKKTGSRFESLLTTLGLEDRLVYDYIKPEDVSFEIDYTAVDERLKAFKESSIAYLKKALE